MDANTIRIILIVTGAVLILLLYLWERQRGRDKDVDDDDDRWEAEDEGHDVDNTANPDAPYGIRASKHQPTLNTLDDDRVPSPAPTRQPDAEHGDRNPPARRSAPPPAPTKSTAAAPATKPRAVASTAAPSASVTKPHSQLANSKQTDLKPSAPLADSKPAPVPLEPLLLQVSVMSGRGHTFRGPSVMDVAESCGLHPGEMDIFHCLDEFDDETRVYFSMANLVKPGTFPFDAMNDFTTPGLVLFAQLRGKPEDMTVLDEMIATARKLAISLRGDVLDDMRCSLTVKKQDEMRKAVIANQLRWAKESKA